MGTNRTVQISFIVFLIAIIIALVVGMVATFLPEFLISRSFPLYTEKPWVDFITGNPLAGNYVLIKERMMGVQVLAASIASIFILFKAFRKKEKWAYYCMLVVTVIVFGSALVESITFKNPPVIIISVIGLVLVATGSIISKRTFITKQKK